MTPTAPSGDGAPVGPTVQSTEYLRQDPRTDRPSSGPVRLPAGIEVAAAWAWRALLLAAVVYVGGRLISTFALVWRRMWRWWRLTE